jgi:hypothetical protein
VTIQTAWNERLPQAIATVSGTTAAGHIVAATLPAPT